ncbi:restriction endonuclease subunit S [Campylobacter felis]|uniref:Restriction endonuclease subunit S n=1 Tax=Campylobacter felis TaxID=2974565 RepID=A0ABT7I3J0_9BACT|nr:restriction endonuclease subunit S [Campylobacter felis]MDL0146858.1 restriction endonuclease subunit S [Campylobacter felis]
MGIKELLGFLECEKVEFKELGELCEINGGKLNANKAQSKGLYEFFTYDYNNPKFVNNYAWDTEALIICKKDNGENPCRYFNGKFNAFQWMRILHSFKNGANIHYIKYYFNAIFMQFLQTNSINISLPYIAIETIKKFQIPLPPLEIQQKIVDILDAFTELQAELQAELHARRKQYEYYRNKLLSFEELEKRANAIGGGLKLVSLGEVCEKISNIKWKEMQNQTFKYIDLTSVDRENCQITQTQTITKENAPSRAQQIVQTDDVICGTTRPTLQRYCHITKTYDKQICSTGFCVLRANKKYILPKWIFFNLKTSKFLNHIERFQQGASYPSIADADLKNFQIPLPPLKVQNDIVELLDKFDTLTNDLTSGIPAEIDARKKQYEHYRERLLSFIAKD